MKTKILPPTYLNALLILQIALHFVLPIRQIVHTPYKYFGSLLFIAGITLNVHTVKYLDKLNTTSDFFKTAAKLVMTGPFRRSRNPIYLSGIVVSLGIAVFLGSLITFVIPILVFLLVNYLYIPDEEQRLEVLFGKDYLDYKQRVRRWI